MNDIPMFEWLLKGPATLCGCLVVVGFLWYRLRIQEQRLLVMSSFVAALFHKSVVLSRLCENQSSEKDSVHYNYLLDSIHYDFENMNSGSYKKLLLSKYNLFFDENHFPSNFGVIYEDLLIRMIKEQFSDKRGGNFSDHDLERLKAILKKHEDFRNKIKTL